MLSRKTPADGLMLVRVRTAGFSLIGSRPDGLSRSENLLVGRNAL